MVTKKEFDEAIRGAFVYGNRNEALALIDAYVEQERIAGISEGFNAGWNAAHGGPRWAADGEVARDEYLMQREEARKA